MLVSEVYEYNSYDTSDVISVDILKDERLFIYYDISFSNMDNKEFEEVYNKVLSVVADFLGNKDEEIINELIKF